MDIKKIILFVIVLVYSVYYAVIFFGLMKKDFIVEDGSATTLQTAVAFITPTSPHERNKEVKKQISFLNNNLSMEEDNLRRYEEWRANAIANPPGCEAGRKQLREELDRDPRPRMLERIEKLKGEISKLKKN